MFNTLHQHLLAFDEYPVENFHSVLRRRTKETDTADHIALKAKEIDACKNDLNAFQSVFVPPRKFNFSTKRIDQLKTKAAKFLTNKFKTSMQTPTKLFNNLGLRVNLNTQASGNFLTFLVKKLSPIKSYL